MTMQRKTVTVVFCDVTGSTALGESTDPEALRALLARYFERMKGIVESHGGSVEKFIGDAVMAVFGVPRVHEDDALRACRAAVEMREASPDLGVQGSVGVNTGEVVTGTEERLATGDAVNVAARLEQAAGSGEILIGEPTCRIVRGRVEVDPVEPPELEGTAERVPDDPWGADTVLAPVEAAGLLSSRGPILRLCPRRPDLLTTRGEWPVPLRLEPLPADQVDVLIGDELPPEFRRRVAQAAGGNPLFLTEMLAMTAESGEVDVPPTLRALLETRLDQLARTERRVLERGAVEGEIFHRGAVQALDPEEAHVSPRLAALVRRELIRPTRTLLPGDDAFRFRHLLIRDTAYDALPKSVRAELHERFAHWLEERATELVELDEILGHHLEQACRYREQLPLPIAGELRKAAR